MATALNWHSGQQAFSSGKPKPFSGSGVDNKQPGFTGANYFGAGTSPFDKTDAKVQGSCTQMRNNGDRALFWFSSCCSVFVVRSSCILR